MTAAGGWLNFYGDTESSQTPTAFDEPPDPPTFDTSSGYPEGGYRYIRRVDGRIESVRWTAESSDCDQYYATQRERKRQHERLDRMSADEIQTLLQDDAFAPLDRIEVLEAILDTIADERSEPNTTARSGENYEPIGGIVGTDIDQDVFDTETIKKADIPPGLKSRLLAAGNRVCYRCHSPQDVRVCRRCGDLVCRDHRGVQTAICRSCESN